MKTDTADIAETAKKLNREKHLNPVATFRRLGIPTSLLAEEITVTPARGKLWVGTKTREFCAPL